MGKGKNPGSAAKSRRSRLRRAAGIVSAAVAGVLGLTGRSQPAHAAITYTWDPGSPQADSSAGTFNSGAWNNVTTNWFNGTNDTNYVNGSPAIFAGSNPGNTGVATVTVATNITTTSLTFNTAGYTISSAPNAFLNVGATNLPIFLNQSATLNATMLGTAGFTTSNSGTLSFGSGAVAQVSGGLTLNGGSGIQFTGSNNTVAYFAGAFGGAGQTLAAANNLVINSGSTLDVFGNNQVFGWLTGTNGAGILTNSNTGTPANVTLGGNTAASFAGTISGAINLILNASGNTFNQTLTQPNTFTGSTTVNGGTFTLGGLGQLLNTSGITVNDGALTMDNTLSDVTNRISSSIPLTLNAGGINFFGNAASTVSQQTFGTVTLNSGLSTFTVNGGTSSGVATLTLGNLARTNIGSEVTFTSSSTNGLGGSTLAGDTGTSVVFINNLNGSTFGTSGLTNNIIAGWALVQSASGANADFASYTPTGGVIALGNTNAVGYNAAINSYTATNIATSTPTSVVNLTGTVANVTNRTIFALKTGEGFTITAGNTLTIGSGGIIGTATGSFTIATGNLTAGTSSSAAELDVYAADAGSNGFIISSAITNNTNGGSVSLVKSGPNGLFLTGANTYSGNTIVNEGVLTANATNAVPGNLIINGFNSTGVPSIVALVKAAAIASTSNVTINNGGALNAEGASTVNTIQSLNFVNNGGIGNEQPSSTVDPDVTVGNSTLNTVLTITGSINSTNNSSFTTPIIQGSSNSGSGGEEINLNGGTVTVNLSGTGPVGLEITGIGIQNGYMAKTGPGLLNFNTLVVTNVTFSGLDVQQGSVEFEGAGPTVIVGLGTNTATTVESGGAVYGNNDTSGGIHAITGAINLNGGILGTFNTGQTFISAVTVGSNLSNQSTTNGGEILLVNPYQSLVPQATTISGTFSGSGPLNIVGTTAFGQQGSLTLTGNTNTYDGTVTLSSNAELISQPAQGFGSAFGTSQANTIVFGSTTGNGSTLELLDSGPGNGTSGVSNTLLNYYNNNSLVVNAPGTLIVGKNTGTTATNNTVALNNITFNNATLTVTANNSYAVQIQGTMSGGGTLAGTGPVTVTGTVAPGDAPAILNVNNTSFAFASSGTYAPEINGALPGWQSSSNTGAGSNGANDQINMVAGTGLAINGATLNVRMSNQSSLVAGDEYFLVNETVAPTGTPTNFATVEIDGSVVSSVGTDPTDGATEYNDPSNTQITYELDYEANITTGALTGGNDVVLDVVSVPEPSVLGLLGVGAMGLLARRRRRKTLNK